MKSALIAIAPGFETIEALTIVDVLKRAGFKVNKAAVGGSIRVASAQEVEIVCDSLISEQEERLYDIVIIPGGMPGAKYCSDSKELVELIKINKENGNFIAAICAAPGLVLGANNLLDEGDIVTTYPGFEKHIPKGKWKDERVVVSGNVITGIGPGAALEWALTVLEVVSGKDIASTLRKKMLVV